MWRIHLHNCKHLASIDYYRSDLTSQYQLPSNHSQCSLYDLRCKSLHDYDLDGIRRQHLLDEHKYCAVFSYSGKLQNLTNCYSIILWTHLQYLRSCRQSHHDCVEAVLHLWICFLGRTISLLLFLRSAAKCFWCLNYNDYNLNVSHMQNWGRPNYSANVLRWSC